MRRIWQTIPLLLISACASFTNQESPVQIYNVHQGLARMEATGKWTIYAEGSNFLHQVNGDCMADGKRTPCMWFGVAFEYATNTDKTVLSCKATFSEPTDVVTPREVVATKVSEDASKIELHGRNGKVFWQGFTIADGNTKPHTTAVICGHGAREVLRYAFTITEQPNSTVETDARKSGARGSP